MRSCVKYGDAHKGFIPIPRVRTRVVLYDDLHQPETQAEKVARIQREDAVNLPDREWVRYESPPEPKCSRQVFVKPYDWKKRRAGVLERFKDVKNWVQPLGYTTAFTPKTLPGKSLTEQEVEEELTYLVATQEQDLAPLWKELAANGVPAQSKDAPREGEDGAIETGDVPDGTSLSTGLSDQYESGRREQWAHETDERTWHSTYARKAHRVERDGRRGIVPASHCVFSADELRAMLSRKPGEHVDEGEIGFYLDNLDISEDRNEFEVADQLARYEEDRNGYAAGSDCPEQQFPRVDGTPLCQNGTVPITEAAEVVDYEDCPTCGGTGAVQSLLGSDLTVVDSE